MTWARLPRKDVDLLPEPRGSINSARTGAPCRAHPAVSGGPPGPHCPGRAASNLPPSAGSQVQGPPGPVPSPHRDWTCTAAAVQSWIPDYQNLGVTEHEALIRPLWGARPPPPLGGLGCDLLVPPYTLAHHSFSQHHESRSAPRQRGQWSRPTGSSQPIEGEGGTQTSPGSVGLCL